MDVETNNHDCKCRLCDGALVEQFQLGLLQRHQVGYFKCQQCQSLQTESPYWLDEAYGNKNLSNLDTWVAQRNIHNLAACYAIANLFKAFDVIDVGGGDGLLCRLLRDVGINCYVKDKYAIPTYAQGYSEENFERPDLVVAFEVLEHLVSPKSDLENLFKYQSPFLLLSTILYEGQGPEWEYLAPESGQHVFFYSRQALSLIAKNFGYSFVLSGGFILFFKDGTSKAKIGIARILLSWRVCRLLKALTVLLPPRGALNDFNTQRAKAVK